MARASASAGATIRPPQAESERGPADMEASLTLSLDMMLVLGVLGIAIVLFVTEWLSADVAALLILLMLGLMKLLPPEQLFAGFASNAVIAILAAMILGVGLDRTGALNNVAGWILRVSGGDEGRLVLALSLVAGAISAFMQNPALVALMLPVAARIASRTGYPLSHLLMPMGFCIVLGGTMTTVGNSPMILLNDLIEGANRNLPQGAETLDHLHMFAVLPIGASLLVLGLMYFRLFGARLLPSYEDRSTSVTPGTTESYFEKLYGTEGELAELRVLKGSSLHQLTIMAAEALPDAPLLLALKGHAGARLAPPGDTLIEHGDVLGALGTHAQIAAFAEAHGLALIDGHQELGELFDPERAGVAEAVLPPGSRFVGRTGGEIRMRRRYGIAPLAVLRGEEVLREDLRGVTLKAGDCLIIHGAWADLAEHGDERDFIVVTDFPKTVPRPQKLLHALICFALGFGLAFSGLVPLSVGLMAGAAGMVISGVVSMDEVYKSIGWKTVFLLACLVPVGNAFDATGAAAWLAQEMIRFTGQWPELAIQLVLAAVATMFAMVMSQIGATVIMVPMAINIALAVNGNPTEYTLIVALAANNNFITGTNAVNTLVSGPAGYRPTDYWRAGLPLMVMFVLLSVFMVRLFF